MDEMFKNAIGDYNSLYISGSDGMLSSGLSRFNRGIEAGNRLLELINNKEVKLAKGESIKLVSHSQGAALNAGIAQVIADAGFKVEVMYNLAPKQSAGFSYSPFINRIVQYFSPNDWYIAPFVDNGRGEQLPLPKQYQDILTGGHLLGNYKSIFREIQIGQNGYVYPRKDK